MIAHPPLPHQVLDCPPLGTIADEDQPGVRPSFDDPFDGPDRGGMVLQVIEPGHLDHDEVVGLRPPISESRLRPFRSREWGFRLA